MLMGMNTNRSVLDANKNQRNAKIIVSMVENLASEGSITELNISGDPAGNSNTLIDMGNREWTLSGLDGIILSYSPFEKCIYGKNDSILMEGVNSSTLTLSTSPLGGSLLGFSLETDDGFYSTAVYSRGTKIEQDSSSGIIFEENNFYEIIDSSTNSSASSAIIKFESASTSQRITLLEKLLSQYNSTGLISNTNTPYSLWYCQQILNCSGYPEGWNENTPWCACFLAWGLRQSGFTDIPVDADVEILWKKLQDQKYQAINPISVTSITPGDLVFFDWENDTETDSNPDLEHVGVVFYVDTHYVYTIEGNSNNRVTLRRYSLNDDRIYNYVQLRL